MSHIFISYSRKDIDFTQKIVDALTANNLDTWIDWKSIPKGEKWLEEIYRGIEEADAFLFLISPDSVKSENCNKEIIHAAKNNKRIIPVVVRDTEEKTVPSAVSERNWIFCRYEEGEPDTTIDDFGPAIQETYDTIHTDYKWLRYHTELQIKALKWEQKTDASRLLRGKELQEAEELLVAAGTQKEPQPTDLQRLLVLTSRKSERNRRQLITSTSVGVTIIVCVLCIFAAVARNVANQNENARQTADANTTVEANARATAEANALVESNTRVTAEANTIIEAQIGLAQKLSSQAQTIYANRDSSQLTAILLAVQSMKIFPSSEASQLLQNNLLANPVRTMRNSDYVLSVAFSPDGKYVASGGCDTKDVFGDVKKEEFDCVQGSARLWDVATGNEVARVNFGSEVSYVTFSPDGKYVAAVCNDYNNLVWEFRIWEAATANEVMRVNPDDNITAITFSPNGKDVAAAGGGIIKIWETTTGKEVVHINGSVNSLTFSPDGKYLASSTSDGIAHVWEVANGTEIARMRYERYVSSVAFSPNGKYLATGGRVTTDPILDAVRVLDIETGQELVYMPHEGIITWIAFSPDGKYIAAGGYSHTILVWEASTGNEIARMTHDDSVLGGGRFSPDSRKLLSISNDKTARLWDITTGKEIARVSHENEITSIALSPDGIYLVSGGDDATIRLWRTTTAKDLVGKMYDKKVIALSFSSDGKRFLSVSEDNYVRVWEADTGKETSQLFHGSSVLYATFSPNGKYVFSRSSDNVAHLWEVHTGKEIFQMRGGDIAPFIVFSPDNEFFASTDYGNLVQVWKISSIKEISRFPHNGGKSAAVFSPDSKHIISGSNDTYANVWEIATGKEISRVNYDSLASSAFAYFSPDGRFIVSDRCNERVTPDTPCAQGTTLVWEIAAKKEIARFSYDNYSDSLFTSDGKYLISWGSNTINIWEVATGRAVAVLSHTGSIYSIALSQDDKYLVSGSDDDTARVWEVATGKEIARMTYEHFNGSVYDVAFSPDGKFVVSGSIDRTARVWESLTGKEIVRMTHDDYVGSVVFSPDGKFVVSGSSDQTIRVWDATTGKEITRFTDGSLGAFSPDGKYVIAYNRLWLWRPEDLIHNACSYLPRNLTYEEWALYVGDLIPYQAVCPNLSIDLEPMTTPTP